MMLPESSSQREKGCDLCVTTEQCAVYNGKGFFRYYDIYGLATPISVSTAKAPGNASLRERPMRPHSTLPHCLFHCLFRTFPRDFNVSWKGAEFI